MTQMTVIGCGYLGAVHAACMAQLGHDVVGIDVDAAKIEALSEGRTPFFEPGFGDILRSALESGRLVFTTDFAAARGRSVHFLCVGTPQKRGEYAADLAYVDAAVAALAPHLTAGDLVVGKSTVPVGTAGRLSGIVDNVVPGALLAWNPEFLREGFAVQDTLSPDRLVYGLPAGAAGEHAQGVLNEVYASVLAQDIPLITTDYATAELVKAAANSFLATKISFINAMAEVCEASGADVVQLADAIGHDTRIGRRFLNAGLGFGGGCLPKDIRAFMARAGELGADQALAFLREIDSINLRRRVRMVDLAREMCGGSIVGRRIAVLGLAFKPNSDDIRDSPALNVAAQMKLQGASVVVTDPEAVPNAMRVWPDLSYAETAEQAAQDADLVMLLTEWDVYRNLDPDKLATVVADRRMLDGRNALEPAQWRAAGWAYKALGRP
jgi:UDPglucose 6-dehydrogenase